MLRWYQQGAHDAIIEFLETQPGNPIVSLPTGTGKSHVIAETAKTIMHKWPQFRGMMLTHDKNLIEQNARKMQDHWPSAPLGIYSAGLNRREAFAPLVFGGIQSVYKRPEEFGTRNWIIVDEAHLVSPQAETMYRGYAKWLHDNGVDCRFIGLTATPFRLKLGLITDSGFWSTIVYDMSSMNAFNRLVNEGYLAKLVANAPRAKFDMSNIGINADGEFRSDEAEAAFTNEHVLNDAIDETVEKGAYRRSWLVFAAGVHHSEIVAQKLQQRGINALPVHSQQKADINDKRITAYKNGSLRCIVNSNMLTTGFDDPKTDMIVMLRPTMSPGLWVQMLGRGTRPFPGKENCLVLDFARNAARLGPINDPVIPRRERKGKARGAASLGIIRLCDNCENYFHAVETHCPHCGVLYVPKVKIEGTADEDAELMRTNDPAPQTHTFEVDHVHYAKHVKEGSIPCLRVVYRCGLNQYTDFIWIESKNQGRKYAVDWWRERNDEECPKTVDEVMQYVKREELRQPKRIKVWTNAKYPRVLSAEYW